MDGRCESVRFRSLSYFLASHWVSAYIPFKEEDVHRNCISTVMGFSGVMYVWPSLALYGSDLHSLAYIQRTTQCSVFVREPCERPGLGDLRAGPCRQAVY